MFPLLSLWSLWHVSRLRLLPIIARARRLGCPAQLWSKASGGGQAQTRLRSP